jgi:glycosyltransferase involved in cell wall biosynthesis
MSKILIISPYYWPANNGGGGQVSVENMVASIQSNNEITVLCNKVNLTPQAGQNFILVNNGIKIIYFSWKNFLRVILFFRKKKFDVIYFNSFFSPLCIVFNFIFFFRSYLKVIISPKGELYEGALKNKYFLKKCWLFLFKKTFKRFVLHSTSFQESNLLKLIFPDNIIKLARDIPSQNINISEPSNLESNTFKIIFCSSIVPKKNLEFVISILMEINSPIIFDIWGHAADQMYFNGVLEKLKKMPKNINWSYKGSLPFSSAKSIFNSYDLFIFPTLGENYGHVIYESLACGCPVLLSKGTTPWDNLESKGVGYNLHLNDKNIWIEKVNFFIKLSSEYRNQQKWKCKSYIAREFDINTIIIENQNLFNLK